MSHRIVLEQAVAHGTLRKPIPAQAFKAKSLFRIECPAGLALYKLTHAAAVEKRSSIVPGRDGFISPWWFCYESTVAVSSDRKDDVPIRGIADKLEGASRTVTDLPTYLRSRGAVCHDWNVMTHLLVLELARPVVGLLGPCSGQPLFDDVGLRTANRCPNISFIGGEQQIYLPGLRPLDVSLRAFGRCS